MTHLSRLARKVILFIPLLLVCVSTQPSMAADQVPNSLVFKGDFASVWKATVVSIAEGGMSIQQQDKETGVISTDWYVLKQPGIFGQGWQVRANVVVKKKTATSTEVINKLVFQNKIGKSEWRPASEDNNYAPKMTKNLFEHIQKTLDTP